MIADSGLRCPTCDYNLTGVVEDRCPECGKPFDRGQLIAAQAGAPSPIPIWDDASRNVLLRFIHICLLTWFRPTRFAALLPNRPSPASVRKFRRIATAATLVACVLPALFASHPGEAVPLVLGIGLAWWFGASLTERMLAALFSPPAKPDAGLNRMYDPIAHAWWRGLFGFFRSFMLVQVLCTIGAVPAAAWGTLPLLGFLALPTLWWWLSVCAILLSDPRPLMERVSAVLISPFCVCAAGLVVLAVGYALILICGSLMNF